ncbi:hypothetical protein [Streptosporangium sp. NPDC051022]|uniref:hypothetical protein n=1 Tax=Streptosporangium sp. NPDC051022 TaxID=3155752 RepID=UPI00343C3362
MASEQSSQSHLPPAWPEAAEPTPTWANDSLGTSPRLPFPPLSPDRPQPADDSSGSSAGNGWDQTGTPQTSNGWNQASTPQTSGGWEHTSTPQTSTGWDQAAATRPGTGWDQTSASPAGTSGGGGWEQAAPSPNGGWEQAMSQSGFQDGRDQAAVSSPGEGWDRAASAPAGNGHKAADDSSRSSSGNGWDQASTPQTSGGWGHTSTPQTGTGWDHTSTPQTSGGWGHTSTPQTSGGWGHTSTPQTSGGWDQAGASPSAVPQAGASAASTPLADGTDGSWADAFTPPKYDDEPQQDGAPAGTESWDVPPLPSREPGASLSASKASGGGDVWPTPAQTGGAGWPSASPATNAGWPSTTPAADNAVWSPSTPATDNAGWPSTTPAADNAGWPSTGPATDNAVWPPAASATWPSATPADGTAWPPTASTAPAANAGQPSATPADNGWPSTTPAADNAVWSPSIPVADNGWPSATPGDGAGRPSGVPTDNAVWPPAAAEAQNPLSPSWGNAQPPVQSPVTPFGEASAANGASPDGGAPFGNGGTPGGFGVPNNPALWALASTTAPEAPAGAPPSPGAPQPYGMPQAGAYPAQDVPPGPPPGGLVYPPQAQQPGPGRQPQPGQPGQHPQGQPGHHLSQDPSDPYRPFVTAGQISGPKTPPPERQQELWDTVFGDNYQAMGDEDDLDGQGRPVWVFALAGSVVIALVGALIWAFMAGPLAPSKEEPTPQAKPSASPKKPVKSQTIGRLPRFPGKASPVSGIVSDQAAAISVPHLGGPWREDQRRTVPTVYGFTTRQYVPAGTDSAGRAQFAQLMSGVLSPRLKDKYTSPENLAPVINAVALGARKKFFPEGNIARKTAQQPLSVNGLPGQLAAYEITAGDSKTTLVVAIVSTGADLPSVVYMSVPDSKKELLPDINTVFKSIQAVSS